MLDQVIYTRCVPHRDLRNNGVIFRQEGFGVFSMSQSIFASGKEIDFTNLQRQLAKQNGAKENGAVGLITSYEYTSVSDSSYAMTYEVSRPHGQVPRKNGIPHRSGNFIKQSLVGELKGYPCEFFGANCWTAHQKGENDYYLDDDPMAEPAWLPQLPDTAVGGNVTRDRVREFVRDGRANAVKTAVWFLLEEFSKPLGERKVLLIKDLPANVELWLAAIEYGFSATMARQITFATNRTKLGGQTEIELFYYTDAAGKFYPNRSGGSAMTRNPYYMIVGYHPQDQFCASLRQLPTSNFVILDGAAKKMGISAESEINASYYEALVQYDADIEDFCDTLLPRLSLVKITNALPKLYDAYKYLLDSSHSSEKWSYTSTLEHMNCLTSFGMPSHDALNKYLLDECIRAYDRFAEQDENSKYPLLNIMWKFAALLHREQDVTACVVNRIAGALDKLNSEMLPKYWHAAEKGGIAAKLRPALRAKFGDAELQWYSAQFGGCSMGSIRVVADIYLTVLDGEQGGLESLMQNKGRFEFISDVMVHISDSCRDTTEMLRKLGRIPNLVNALSVAVAERLEWQNPRKAEQWWDIVAEVSGGNLLELCRCLVAYDKVQIELVEKLLTNHVRRTGSCSREVEEVLAGAIARRGPKSDTGRLFFLNWIGMMKVEETARIVQAARKMKLSQVVGKEIFERLDDAVGLEIATERYYDGHVRELEVWSKELNIVSRTLAIGKFHRELNRAWRVDDAIRTLREFGEKKIVMDERFIDSDSFGEIAKKVHELVDKESKQRDKHGSYDDMELTLELLLAFRFDSKDTKRKFVEEYVKTVLNAFRGTKKICHMVILTEAVMTTDPRYGKRGALVKEVQEHLENAMRKEVPKYIRPGDMDKIQEFNCDAEVKSELLDMIRKSGRNIPSGNKLQEFMGNLGGLFRKK